MVTVHVAQSLDGRLSFRGATASLSTLEGQRSAHAARAAHDAVLVGIETVRIDDPCLTVRHVDGKDPLRVVLASMLDVPLSARLFTDGRLSPLVIGAQGRAKDEAHDALTKIGADVAIVEATFDGMVSLRGALDALASRGVKRLLVEGGSRVLTSFFRERLVNRVEIEIAMCVLGEPNTPTLGALGVNALHLAPKLANVSIERLGTSVLVRGDVIA